jgi:hypothetical protein
MPLAVARCDGEGMKRGLGLAAAAALVAGGVTLHTTSSVSAAPGQDAVVVVSTFTVAAPDLQGTRTVMCPSGMRATGGGAAPAPPFSLSSYQYRISYSAPVDVTGGAAVTVNGAVPRGWQVSIAQFTNASQDIKAFVVCSATSDAVVAAAEPPGGGVLTATVPCPVGSRAIGGGMGKTTDTAIPGASVGPTMYETGPVDGSGTVAGTVDGDVATGWRTIADANATYGNRFFAICSAGSDAVVRTASYTVPMGTDGAAGAAAVCPAGSRALSGGQAVDSGQLATDRVSVMGPFATPSELATIATGAVPRAWSAYGRSSDSQARTYRVFALCASDPVTTPADTTPPQTTIGKGPKKQTAATKAKFTFSSEAGATFTCRLDKKSAKSCTSPYKVKKLKPGKHKLTVTAKDAAGNTDPSPAVFTWKVVKRKPKPHHPSGCTGECRSAASG